MKDWSRENLVRLLVHNAEVSDCHAPQGEEQGFLTVT